MSGSELTVEREIAGLETAMADAASDYWRGPMALANQDRYRELIRSRESGAAARPVASAQRELSDIQNMMGDYSSPYWKGPDAPRLQRRYRELIGGSVSPESLAGLDGFTADPEAPPRAVEAAASIVRGLDQADRAVLVEAWDWALPDAVRQAAIAELAAGLPSASSVTQEEIEEFAAGDPTSAELVRSWGAAARAKLGVLRARLHRIFAGLSPGDRRQARHWLDNLKPSEFRAIARHLAGA